MTVTSLTTVTPNSTILGAAQLAASNGTAASSNSGSSAAPSALGSLTSNYSDFLSLLTTQLQNQDPTSPMDSSQFTTELVQFSGVEQQINANTNLAQLVSLTQAGNITQASAMLGATVSATSTQLPLQNGSAALSFTAPSAQPVTIAITNANGENLYDGSVNASAGANQWTWNGTDSSGQTLPDGAYNVAVTSTAADGTATALPFTVSGTATSVDSQSNNLLLNLGAVSVPFTAITSVNRANTGS
jgi:flagellar basal-body rod modification protein FlgD